MPAANAPQGQHWFRVDNVSGEPGSSDNPRVAEINIFAQIGESWFDDSGVTAGNFVRAVDALGELDEIMLRINSPGGDVMDGLTITNYLMQHPAHITVRVEGQAASIASVIMMAGDERIMGVGTTVFVHDPLTIAFGDAEDMRKIADELDTIRDGILEVYQQRVDMTRDELVTLLNDDTRMTADEAVTWGFATGSDSTIKAAATTDLSGVLEAAREQFTQFMHRQPSEIEQVRAQLAERDTTIEQLNAQMVERDTTIEQLRAGPPAADAAEVIQACADAKVPEMAAGFVSDKLPMVTVAERLAFVGQVRDLCAAAEEDPGRYLAHIDSPIEMLRTAIVDLQAAKEQEIEHYIPGNERGGKSRVASSDIYRQRNASTLLQRGQ